MQASAAGSGERSARAQRSRAGTDGTSARRRRGLVVVDRQVEREARAFAGRRLTSIVPRCSSTKLRVSERPRPVPPRRDAAAFLGLVELVEDPLQLVGRDADALIGDVDAHGVDAERRAVRGNDVHVDRRPGRPAARTSRRSRAG